MIISSTGRQCCLARGTALALGLAAAGMAHAHSPYQPDGAIHMVTVEDGIFGVVASTDAVIAGLHVTSADTSAAARAQA